MHDSPCLSESLTLSSHQLKRGMFVHALDRPWDQSPWTRGFLLEREGDLVCLRTLCDWVVIDLAQSRGDVVMSPPLAGQAAAPLNDAARKAAAPAPSPASPPDKGAADKPSDLRIGGTVLSLMPDDAEPPAILRGTAPRATSLPAAPSFRVPDLSLVPDDPPSARAQVGAASRKVPPVTVPAPQLKLIDDQIEFRPVLVKDVIAERAAEEARLRMVARAADRIEQPLEAHERSPDVPAEIPLVRYADEATTLKQALPRAEVVAEAAREALENLARDIVASGELQLHEIEATASDLTESIVDNPNALVWLVRVRERDASTYNHGVKVAVYLLTLGRHLGYPPDRLAQLATTGLLLDVGKLFVDAALLRRAGRLTAGEFASVQKHVELGLEALTRAGALHASVYDGIAQHHERLDGSGYPRGLMGNAITIEGKMAAIADSFAAMTSRRSYAEPMTAYEAMRTLYQMAGRSFQASLVEKFVQAVGIFPTGALVELTTGEVAVVIRHNRERRLEPRVLVLTLPDKSPIELPYDIDLMMQHDRKLEQPRVRIAQGLPVGSYGLDVSKYYIGG